jgi:hypothetical protein
MGYLRTIGSVRLLLSHDAYNTNIPDDEMHRNDSQFCTFRDMTSLVMTWNAGASKPTDIRYDEQNSNFFRKMLQTQEAPDVIVFSLQELVDLEDKRLTASKSDAPFVTLLF